MTEENKQEVEETSGTDQALLSGRKVTRRQAISKIAGAAVGAGILAIAGWSAAGYFASIPREAVTVTTTVAQPTTVTVTQEATTVTAPAVGRPSLSELRRAYEGTRLTILLKEGYETTGYKEFYKDFEEATGIIVGEGMEVYDEPTTRNKYVLDQTSKTGTYDVYHMQFWNFPEAVRAGWMEPLNPYIEEQLDPWLDIEAIPKGVREPFTKDGVLYVLPDSIAGGQFYYRKDIFEELDLDPPKTTDDVLNAAEVIKNKTETIPFVGRGRPDFPSFPTSAGWAWGYGAKLLDEDYKPTVDTPEMREAMEDLVKLMKDYGAPGQAGIGWAEMGPMFASGKAAMNFEMSGFGGFYANPETSEVADALGIALVKGPAGNYLQWPYTQGLAMSPLSKKKEAAWLFMQWRVSLETYKKEVVKGIRFDIPHNTIYTLDLYWEEVKKRGPSLYEYAKSLPETFAVIDLSFWPFIPEFVEVTEAFQAEISSAIAGEQSVSEALKKAQDKIYGILKEKGYYS